MAAYVGIDWADQKHDVVLRSAAEPDKAEHQVIEIKPEALKEWIAQMQQRFGGKGKVLVCLEQSRGALIYHLMAYELFELYPINPSQLANYRETFSVAAPKMIGPTRIYSVNCSIAIVIGSKPGKPDIRTDPRTGFLNEGRRKAVDQRTRWPMQLRVSSRSIFRWPSNYSNKISPRLWRLICCCNGRLWQNSKKTLRKLRKFFYGHNSRQEKKILERLALIQQAKPLTQDSAVIEPPPSESNCWPANSRVFCLSSLSTKGGLLSSLRLIPIASSLTTCPGPDACWLPDY